MATMVKCFCTDWRSNTIRCVPTTIEEDSKTSDTSSQLVPIPRLFSWSRYLTTFYVTYTYLYKNVNINYNKNINKYK